MSKNKVLRAIQLAILFCMLSCCLIGCQSAAFIRGNDSSVVSATGEAYADQPSLAALSDQPRQIALLLPLTGPHAQAALAIREGFFASYYDQAGIKPVIKIYDTNKEKEVRQLYDLALSEGADFVVGPLSKEDVLRLSQHRLKTPVLALNRHPDVRAPKHFAQFSLAPETEAEQIAHKAFQHGHRSASIIVPDNAWGKRTAAAFATQWQQQGGRLKQTVYVDPKQEQAGAVRKLLGIDESQQRANKLNDILREKVDFQARRQQDIDMIFMAGPPDQARQLKPLFDFYYAEQVPVYATSSIYSGQHNSHRDKDMNGVVFCDMPWLLESAQHSKVSRLLAQQNTEQSTEQSTEYSRLFAMGIDAYQITGRFKQMQNPRAHYAGATGQLSLRGDNQLHRTLAWAKINNGIPIQME